MIRHLHIITTRVYLLVHLEAIAFGADLCFTGVFIIFLCCEISELCRPIITKFCAMMGTAFN